MNDWPPAEGTAPMPCGVDVICSAPARLAYAQALAKWLDTHCHDNGTDADPALPALVVRAERLELHAPGGKNCAPLLVDFTSRSFHRRVRQASASGERLARAAGVRGPGHPSIVDATAGLGRDSFILASLGCEVLAVERNPVIAALLGDGLQRARQDPTTAATAMRITLRIGDARALLARVDADTVFLDPMYPPRRKSAAVGREMRILQAFAGMDTDSDELLATALATARQRVVVKRPRHAPTLRGPEPTATMPGKSTRFDLYAGDRLG